MSVQKFQMKTLRMIHEAYQQAVEKSSNLLEIANNLYDILNQVEFDDEEDAEAFETFLDGMRGCILSFGSTAQGICILTSSLRRDAKHWKVS